MATPTCKYQYPAWLSRGRCPEPAWDDAGRCFFHSDSHHKVAADMVARVKEKLGRGDKDFTGYVFPAGVGFSGVDFGAGVFFLGATFGERAHFSRATFGEEASFNHATFGEGADFDYATFGQGAGFVGATFGERAYFEGATFGDGLDFRIANPSVRFILVGVTFQGRADFSDETQDWSHLELHGVSLPQALFRGAIGLDTCEFDSVTWGTEGSRQGVLGDEEVARESGKSADFAAAERVYREVRRSYLERRDFTMARQMHWGEMEMRRLKEAARRRESHKWLDRKGLRWLADISLTWVYWWLSGYGQRWGNALVSLTALWLVCALGYTAETLSVANPAPAFAEALMNGVSQSLFSLILRPIYTPATLGGLLINFLQMVLSPIVITTLVLAVREQFRH